MNPEPDNGDALPVEIYRAQVDSMFDDPLTLAVGTWAACGVTLAVAIKHNIPEIASIVAAIALVGAFRLECMRRFAQLRGVALTGRVLRRWEVSYVIGASLHVLLMGAFCFVSFWRMDDEFARLASLSGMMAYLVGVPGRNFASNLLVNMLILAAGIPMVAALLSGGGDFWWIAVLVMAPFFISIRTISVRLRGLFLEAVLRARDFGILAQRFDTALNNMPCGLVMLDSRGRVVVTNERLGELLQTPVTVVRPAEDVRALLNGAVDSGAVDKAQADSVARVLQARSGASAVEKLELELVNGRILDLTTQPMSNGGMVVLFDDITERKRAEARINELARFDSLTGLPNRVEFRERALEALATKDPDLDAAMLFVDLDQFKQINDTLGHAIGDRLLTAASKRLRRSVGEQTLVARLGGDEFVVLISEVETLAAVEDVARAIICAMATPFEIGENTLRVGASIGVARAIDVGCDIDALLRCADMALYQAKAEGRGAWRIFEPGMEARARARRELEFELRLALDNNDLELYFQPLYSVARRKFIGCEALLRWRHATRGSVPPSVFVPIAEEIGLVTRLDAWVLRRACEEATTWPRAYKVAVNLSAINFQNSGIVATIKRALADTGLPPQRLEIEITETALLLNKLLTRSILYELRNLGVRISLDDFGTGYSSLSYLHSLPLNKIKIDRSFLAGVEQEGRALKLLSGVAKLSKDLGLTVVIEGVETQEQFDIVTSATPVDEIQGFLLSRPISSVEIRELFTKNRRTAA